MCFIFQLTPGLSEKLSGCSLLKPHYVILKEAVKKTKRQTKTPQQQENLPLRYLMNVRSP